MEHRTAPTGTPETDSAQAQACSTGYRSPSTSNAVILREISFSVPKGSMSFLLGASGVGESTVLKLILGLIDPMPGTIIVNGERIDDMSESDLITSAGTSAWCSRRVRCSTR